MVLIPKALSDERQIAFGEGLAFIPERLLLAHARREVLFVVGAGVSCQAQLPNFRELVLRVYKIKDGATHRAMSSISDKTKSFYDLDVRDLMPQQKAEVRRFFGNEHDVVLGMLERRMDLEPGTGSSVREVIADELRRDQPKPAPIHRALVRLANRGQVAIATTNFDRLLEDAAKMEGYRVQSYTLGGIPRPSLQKGFSGVFHIHGVLDRSPSRSSDLVVTDQDFGEFYLRRRVVPDFIYDAARLFSLVLVGYSASDPPMRYLLNAVAADGTRFRDIQARYAFVAADNDLAESEITMEDWRSRGIIPIQYPAGNSHEALCASLQRWAELSDLDENSRRIEAEVVRIVKKKRDDASEVDRDLFDHLVRRGNLSQRKQLAALASKYTTDFGWLDAIHDVVTAQTPTR